MKWNGPDERKKGKEDSPIASFADVTRDVIIIGVETRLLGRISRSDKRIKACR